MENAEWVMFVDDRFIPMAALYASVNAELERTGRPPLRVGDEVTVTVRRADG
ncbi:hypothetical protein [Paenibacillus hamazuiensis]|uniref:hypothetical protein n=1 Tax=Paenibacillus hamazuiensis TaxID=2936508 RepID=UPI00200C88AE|nr:hypothetical protein [Paenibacillus hamazuiensis]